MSNVKNFKPDPTLLGNAIVQARQKKQLTQQQLADALGVTNKTISKWECGRGLPDQSMFEPLERILEISVSDYVGDNTTSYYTHAATLISRITLVAPSVLVVVCCGIVVATSIWKKRPIAPHVCKHLCSVCGKCTSDCDEAACLVKCNGHYDVEGFGEYIFEAEDCNYSGGLCLFNDAGSGKGYLGNFDFHGGEKMTYTFTSRNAVGARLYFSLVPRGINDVCNDTYTVSLNGEILYSRAVFRGVFASWQNFVEYYIADVVLASGENRLEVTYNSNEGHNNGHNFDYVKFNTRRYEKSDDILLEAEESLHDESLRTRYEAGSGLGYIGDFDTNDGATMNFEFVAESAEKRSMFFALATRGIADKLDETYTISLNGNMVLSNSVVYGTFDGPNRWTDFKEYYVADVVPQKGVNKLSVVFNSNATEIKNGNNGHNFDYVRLVRSYTNVFDGKDMQINAESAMADKLLSLESCSDGKKYIGNFDGVDLAEVRFFVNSQATSTVALTLNIVPRGHNELITDSFDIYVNGVALYSENIIDGAYNGYENFVDYFVSNIILEEGDNEILLVFKSNQDRNNGHNLADIKLGAVG